MPHPCDAGGQSHHGLASWSALLLALMVTLWLVGCAAPHRSAPHHPTDDAPISGAIDAGLASWYGQRFQGRRTASGEAFDKSQLTAAHKSLPFGTRVRVHNLDNGRDVLVRINDRGPFKPGRVIDLSHAAAAEIGILQAGTARVAVYRD